MLYAYSSTVQKHLAVSAPRLGFRAIHNFKKLSTFLSTSYENNFFRIRKKTHLSEPFFILFIKNQALLRDEWNARRKIGNPNENRSYEKNGENERGHCAAKSAASLRPGINDVVKIPMKSVSIDIELHNAESSLSSYRKLHRKY